MDLNWRDGAGAAEVANVSTACEVIALQNVPRAMTSYTTPTYTTPADISCTGSGNMVRCHDDGSQTYGGYTRTEDVNQGLRDRVLHQCLASRGVTTRTFERCSDEDAKRAVTSRTLPPAQKVLCVTDKGYVLR